MLEQLKQISIFSSLSARDLSACELLLDWRRLKSGERLWLQGEPSEELAFILAGNLDITIADHKIATLPVGEMVGELAVFTRDQRTASVLGGSDGAEIACLSRSNLQTLSQVMPTLYDNLLDIALDKSARRVHQMGKQSHGLPTVRPVRPKNQTIRWPLVETDLRWQSSESTPALSAIRKLPRLKSPIQHLAFIIASMTYVSGASTFLEGDVSLFSFWSKGALK